MITKITVSQNINLQEYTYIRGSTNISDPVRVRQYARYGFSLPYFGEARNHSASNNYSRVYLISFDVNPTYYYDDSGNLNAEDLKTVLNRFTSVVDFHERPWIIEKIDFSQRINTGNADTYAKLLNYGYSMNAIGMTKKLDNHLSPSTLIYNSNGAEMTISDRNNDTLLMKLSVKKSRLKTILKSRKVEKLDGCSKDFELACWDYYIENISGQGDYYSLHKAEDKISAHRISRRVKERYVALLKCVTHYKGLEMFLSHIGHTDRAFRDIELFSSRKNALKDINVLEASGVNPVTISRRSSVDFLPNIRTLISV